MAFIRSYYSKSLKTQDSKLLNWKDYNDKLIPRVVIGFAVSILLLSIASSQVEFENKGWGQIEFIEISILKNPILSYEDTEHIVKAIGYKILPQNIKFYRMIRYPKEYYDRVKEIAAIYKEKDTTIYLPDIQLWIYLNISESNGERYYGSIRVSLETTAIVHFLQSRSVFPNSDLAPSEWRKYIGNVELISKGYVIKNYSKNSIIDKIREMVRDVFEELAIKIRENP